MTDAPLIPDDLDKRIEELQRMVERTTDPTLKKVAVGMLQMALVMRNVIERRTMQ